MDATKMNLNNEQFKNILMKAYCLFFDNEPCKYVNTAIRLSSWISGYLQVDDITATNIMLTIFDLCKEVVK